MNLPSNLFDENFEVQTFLCQPNKEIIGEILPYDFSATFKFNTYSEISFTIDKYYNDLFDGATKVHPCYHLIESLRIIYIRGVGHFIIQDVNENESDTYTKTITCYSLEYNTGQKYLENFYVNTGEEGSIETMYHAQQYGAEYSIDNYYTLVNTDTDTFDPYEKYYIKRYINENGVSYNYEEVPVLNKDDFQNNYRGDSSETTLYVKKYSNVRFYWPTKPGLSLLHHIFDHIPEWKIGHVDKDLWYQERTFAEDRTSVYDFLYNTAAKTLKFIMVWDSINGVVNFFKTEEDGLTSDNYIRTNNYSKNFIYYSDANGTIADPQPQNEDDVIDGEFYINVGQDIETQWDTDVFISHENLTSKLDIQYNTDDIKTKLRISGSDTLDVRDVNLGQNSILDLSYYNDPMWLGVDLHDKYNRYSNALVEHTKQYKDCIAGWTAAYNEYSDLMNYVPVEPRVMLVGDEFEKLYCTYSKYKRTLEYKSDKIYYIYEDKKYIQANPQPTSDQVISSSNYYYVENIEAQVKNLKAKLDSYQVDRNDKGERSTSAKSDDVLLTLENARSDSVTIRVRYDQDTVGVNSEHYVIYRTFTSASTDISNTEKHSIEDWVSGKLTATELKLTGIDMVQPFTIKSIGTLGAYFCLTRDETSQEELEDYGIRLLQEKKDVYTKIFVTQTEGYMNKESARCIVSDEKPEGSEYPVGTRWLDSNSGDENGNLKLYRYDGTFWQLDTSNENDYKNYARFYENYVKLGNVQAVLAKKQKQADYLLNGVPMNSMYLDDEHRNIDNLYRALLVYFMVDGNDYYITTTGQSQPDVNNITEGSVWIDIDAETLTTTVKQCISKQWSDYDIPNINIALKHYDEYFNYLAFDTDFKVADKPYQDWITYYIYDNGKYIQANSHPSTIQNEIDTLAQTYNTLVNGNVDYSKRPFISSEVMKRFYPEFEGEIATTYDRDVYAKDSSDAVVCTIKFTPILNDGSVLPKDEANAYAQHLTDIIYEGGTINDVLDWDYHNKKIVINVADGETTYNEEGMSELDIRLDEIKQRHWELSKDFMDKTYYTGEEYVIYVVDGIPHVSYSRSQGLYLAKMNIIKEAADMNKFFTKQELIRLSPFIREDEYSDSNFLLTGYESEEEEMYIKQELLNAGIDELKKICQPKLSFSIDMANILAISEFAPLRNQFKLGNFIRIGIREGYVKRARLLEVQINFDDISNFSATFGDLISTRSEVDKHAELLQQAVTAGKSVASNQSMWQRGANKATELDQAINDGLRNAALSVGAADGQAISWDKYGIRGRKLKEGSTDEYEDEQFALINNKLAFTTDNWQTSRAVVGEFEVELPNEEGVMTTQNMYGLLADAIVGGYIQGSVLKGGSLEIGDGETNLFSVDEAGNVTIKQGGKNMYEAITAIDTAYRYSVQLSFEGNTVFGTLGQSTTVTAKIFRRSEEITDKCKDQGVIVKWIRTSSADDSTWEPIYTQTGTSSYHNPSDTYQIKIKNGDIPNTAQISCYIEPTETQINKIEEGYDN